MSRKTIILLSILSLLIAVSWLYSQRTSGNRYQLSETKIIPEAVNRWVQSGEGAFIAINEKQIRWYKNEQLTTFSLPEDVLKVIFSRGRNYFAVLQLSPISEGTVKETRDLKIDVFDDSQKHLFQIVRAYDYDAPIPLVGVSDKDGAVILADNATGKIHFYNSRGVLLKTVHLFEDGEYDLERPLQMDISKEGTRVAIVAGKRGASPKGSGVPNPSAEPHLFLFSIAGVELWQTPLPHMNTTAVAISDDGKYIAANSYTMTVQGSISKKTLVYDDTGRKIGEANLLFKRAVFSPDSNWLLMAENHLAIGLDVLTGNVVWHYPLSEKEQFITAVATSTNGERSVLLLASSSYENQRFRYTHPRMIILNRQGEILQKVEIPGKNFITPSLSITDDARRIMVGFTNEYQIYQVK